MREHDDHEQPQRKLVLRTVDALEKRELLGGTRVSVGCVHGGLVFGASNSASIV
jgi:hypothetical protein